MITVDLKPGPPRDVPGHSVYVRQHWWQPWSLVQHLHCAEAVWTAAPTIPTATLIWHYGDLRRPGAETFATVPRISVMRHYAKVVFSTDDDDATRTWWGIVVGDHDEMGGDSPATGTQTLLCYGMEQLLAWHLVDSTMFVNALDDPVRETAMAVTFNRGGPNRSPGKLGPSHVFADQAPQWWSSRDIVEYLLAHMVPHDHLGNVMIPWKLVAPDRVQGDDRPELPTDGMTTHGLLSQLMDRRRLRTWHARVNENDVPHSVEIVPSTLTISGVTFPHGFGNVPANPLTRRILLHDDPLSAISVRTDGLQRYDQVIARGARMRAVGTFAFEDATLQTFWLVPSEVAYEKGASELDGYDDLDDDEKRKRNAEVRSLPLLRDVFQLFTVPFPWDFRVGDGLGGATSILFLAALGDVAQQYRREVFVESTLPLLEGVDYEGTPPAAPLTGEERRPLLVLARPSDEERWVAGDRVAEAHSEIDEDTLIDGENNRWSAAVVPVPDSTSLRIIVQGDAQHVIAATDFEPLDVDLPAGGYDYRSTAALTLSLLDNRRLEARWPETEPAGPDAIRHKEILAEQFGAEYIAPETIVGIDEDGALVRSDGGFLRDDSQSLEILARTAADWYLQDHAVVHLKTYRHPSQLAVGHVIVSVEEGTLQQRFVNAPITEVRLTTPLGDPASPQEPQLEIVTWAGELDAVQLVPHDPPEQRRQP